MAGSPVRGRLAPGLAMLLLGAVALRLLAGLALLPVVSAGIGQEAAPEAAAKSIATVLGCSVQQSTLASNASAGLIVYGKGRSSTSTRTRGHGRPSSRCRRNQLMQERTAWPSSSPLRMTDGEQFTSPQQRRGAATKIPTMDPLTTCAASSDAWS